MAFWVEPTQNPARPVRGTTRHVPETGRGGASLSALRTGCCIPRTGPTCVRRSACPPVGPALRRGITRLARLRSGSTNPGVFQDDDRGGLGVRCMVPASGGNPTGLPLASQRQKAGAVCHVAAPHTPNAWNSSMRWFHRRDGLEWGQLLALVVEAGGKMAVLLSHWD